MAAYHITQSRSLRDPDRDQGSLGSLDSSFMADEAALQQPRSACAISDRSWLQSLPRDPGSQTGHAGYYMVGVISRRFFVPSFTHHVILSQARHLGGLHRASPVPFRGSYFTSRLHPPDATPQRLIACLEQAMEIFHSFHRCASWRTVVHAPARHARGRHRRRRRGLRVCGRVGLRIERCLEPGKSNFRLWLWLRVPALMSPGCCCSARSCHRLQNAPLPGAKTSRWPSAFFCTNGSERSRSFGGSERSKRSLGLPRLSQSLHPAFGDTCQICQRASSPPITKSSWRRSLLLPTVMRSERRIPTGGLPHVSPNRSSRRSALFARSARRFHHSRRRILLVCHPDFSRR